MNLWGTWREEGRGHFRILALVAQKNDGEAGNTHRLAVGNNDQIIETSQSCYTAADAFKSCSEGSSGCAAMRLMAARNAFALASTLSVETPRPR